MRRPILLILALLQPAASAAQPANTNGDVLPGGARWAAEVPKQWNGTLLLWSRGD